MDWESSSQDTASEDQDDDSEAVDEFVQLPTRNAAAGVASTADTNTNNEPQRLRDFSFPGSVVATEPGDAGSSDSEGDSAGDEGDRAFGEVQRLQDVSFPGSVIATEPGDAGSSDSEGDSAGDGGDSIFEEAAARSHQPVTSQSLSDMPERGSNDEALSRSGSDHGTQHEQDVQLSSDGNAPPPATDNADAHDTNEPRHRVHFSFPASVIATEPGDAGSSDSEGNSDGDSGSWIFENEPARSIQPAVSHRHPHFPEHSSSQEEEEVEGDSEPEQQVDAISSGDHAAASATDDSDETQHRGHVSFPASVIATDPGDAGSSDSESESGNWNDEEAHAHSIQPATSQRLLDMPEHNSDEEENDAGSDPGSDEEREHTNSGSCSDNDRQAPAADEADGSQSEHETNEDVESRSDVNRQLVSDSSRREDGSVNDIAVSRKLATNRSAGYRVNEPASNGIEANAPTTTLHSRSSSESSISHSALDASFPKQVEHASHVSQHLAADSSHTSGRSPQYSELHSPQARDRERKARAVAAAAAAAVAAAETAANAAAYAASLHHDTTSSEATSFRTQAPWIAQRQSTLPRATGDVGVAPANETSNTSAAPSTNQEVAERPALHGRQARTLKSIEPSSRGRTEYQTPLHPSLTVSQLATSSAPRRRHLASPHASPARTTTATKAPGQRLVTPTPSRQRHQQQRVERLSLMRWDAWRVLRALLVPVLGECKNAQESSPSLLQQSGRGANSLAGLLSILRNWNEADSAATEAKPRTTLSERDQRMPSWVELDHVRNHITSLQAVTSPSLFVQFEAAVCNFSEVCSEIESIGQQESQHERGRQPSFGRSARSKYSGTSRRSSHTLRRPASDSVHSIPTFHDGNSNSLVGHSIGEHYQPSESQLDILERHQRGDHDTAGDHRVGSVGKAAMTNIETQTEASALVDVSVNDVADSTMLSVASNTYHSVKTALIQVGTAVSIVEEGDCDGGYGLIVVCVAPTRVRDWQLRPIYVRNVDSTTCAGRRQSASLERPTLPMVLMPHLQYAVSVAVVQFDCCCLQVNGSGLSFAIRTAATTAVLAAIDTSTA